MLLGRSSEQKRTSKIAVFPETEEWVLLVENLNSKSKSNIFIIEDKNSGDVCHKWSQLAEPAWTVLLSSDIVTCIITNVEQNPFNTDRDNFYNVSE